MKHIRRIFLRVRIAMRIIFKERHGLVIVLDREQLTTLITDNVIDKDIQIAYFGMYVHHVGQLVKLTADCISDEDIICNKAEFEVKVMEDKK